MVVLVRDEHEVGSWPLPTCLRPDLALVDTLARFELAARRLGCSVRLREVSCDLAALLRLVGLDELLGARCSVEVGRKPEHLEEPRVEEVVVPDDPVA